MNIWEKIKKLRSQVRNFLYEDVWRINSFTTRQIRKAFLVIKGFNEDRCLMRSSALAYTTLLSLIPLFAAMLLVLKGFGAGSEQDTLLQYVQRMLEQIIPAGSLQSGQSLAVAIAGHIHEFATRLSAARVGGVGVIFLLIAAISILSTAEKSMNDIWGVQKGRSFINRLIVFWAMVTLLPLLMVPAVSTQLIGQSQMIVDWIASYIPISWIAKLIQSSLIPILFMTLGLTLFYMILPNTKVRLRSSFIGAFMAAIALNLVIKLFGMIMMLTGKIDRFAFVYGILAVVPLFLLFAYTAWAIVLLGTEIAFADQNAETYFFEQWSERANTMTKEKLALRLMFEIATAHANDKQVPSAEDLQKKLKLPIRIINETMYILERAELLAPLEGEPLRCLPAHELSHITVGDVVTAVRRDGNDLSLPTDESGARLDSIYRGLTPKELNEASLNLDELVQRVRSE